MQTTGGATGRKRHEDAELRLNAGWSTCVGSAWRVGPQFEIQSSHQGSTQPLPITAGLLRRLIMSPRGRARHVVAAAPPLRPHTAAVVPTEPIHTKGRKRCAETPSVSALHRVGCAQRDARKAERAAPRRSIWKRKYGAPCL